MENRQFRTYRRRSVTRRSGYKASGEKTGGECIILNADAYLTRQSVENFLFFRERIELTELFESNQGILAFGGYIYSQKDIKRVHFRLSYSFGGRLCSYEKIFYRPLKVNDWDCLGFHKELSLDMDKVVTDVKLVLSIETEPDNFLQFIGFDFDGINHDYYKSLEAQSFFYKKTMMHVPHIYYLNTLLPFQHYLVEDDKQILEGDEVVLKSCNRCNRYLPININNEVGTLGFSLHCKKKAPCTHSIFKSYKIDNFDELEDSVKQSHYIKDNRVVTYYGHQLECKACKKFFVNAPLNPMRNSQQFREDSLRRRATEVLVNTLLKKDLVHHEFRKKNKREFSEYIWKKFDGRCFKCGKKLELDEMHLDHTMPLAYLYRLDETATCLCSVHNSQKRDHFPVEFYDEKELIRLSEITGLSLEVLKSTRPNSKVVNLLIQNVTWFFDDFLSSPEYQKVRDGRLTADKIYASLVRVIGNVDLVSEYRKVNNKNPTTITIDGV
ncbi:MAG: hypothetical protein GX750_03890 [Clostridia bacterium]|nr:hypothetical protein [Clostridia bacterium]